VTCSVATLLGQNCIVARDFETRRHTAAVSGRSGMGKRCGPWSAYSKRDHYDAHRNSEGMRSFESRLRTARQRHRAGRVSTATPPHVCDGFSAPEALRPCCPTRRDGNSNARPRQEPSQQPLGKMAKPWRCGSHFAWHLFVEIVNRGGFRCPPSAMSLSRPASSEPAQRVPFGRSGSR